MSKIKQKVNVNGTVQLIKNGQTLHTMNLVVEDGLIETAKAIAQETTAMPTHIALGTEGTAEASGDVSLGSEVVRDSANVSRSGTSVTFENVFTGISDSIREAGLFSDSSDGTMFARTTFDVINLSSQDELTINWTIDANA